MRKVIASRLTESKATVPHAYASIDCKLDNLLELRKQINATGAGTKVSVNDLVIKASALALRDVPSVNQNAEASREGNVDISVAVATPSGLITPIVKDADALSVSEINGCVKDLAARAFENKLKPEEFMGGSFTISNLGMFGISQFSAVINPPQAAILAVGSGLPQCVKGTVTNPASLLLFFIFLLELKTHFHEH